MILSFLNSFIRLVGSLPDGFSQGGFPSSLRMIQHYPGTPEPPAFVSSHSPAFHKRQEVLCHCLQTFVQAEQYPVHMLVVHNICL